MSSFGGLVLTNKGRNLQIKAQLGATIHYTRIGIGDGELGSSSIIDLNALKHEIESLDITKLRVLGDGQAVVGTMLSNQGMVEGFYFREIGIFAQDPDLGEILYCYGNAGSTADYIPAGGGSDLIEKAIDIVTNVGNAANVTAEISSNIYASAQDVESLWIEVDKKVDKVTGKGLSTNDYTDAEKTKLAGLEEGATNYQHPTTHPASMIKMEDGKTVEEKVSLHLTDDVKHVTQSNKDSWDNKAEGNHNHSGVYEPVFSKNNAFNKNFGIASGTVCQGNDSRLSNSRKCNNTFDNASTARTNLGLTGTSNTTHYHDSRYVQTRIYNGSLQYYDGSWKYASDAIYMLSNTIRETQCTTPLTFTQNNIKLAGKFTAKCNGVLRISAELAGASSTRKAILYIHKYTDTSVLPVDAPIGTTYNLNISYTYKESEIVGNTYKETSIELFITAGDVAFIGFGAEYNGDYSAIRNIKIRYDISNAS